MTTEKAMIQSKDSALYMEEGIDTSSSGSSPSSASTSDLSGPADSNFTLNRSPHSTGRSISYGKKHHSFSFLTFPNIWTGISKNIIFVVIFIKSHLFESLKRKKELKMKRTKIDAVHSVTVDVLLLDAGMWSF